jgi:hypothetical protein
MASHGWVENSVVAGNDNWGGVFGFHCSNCSLLLYDPQTKQKSDDDDVVASAAPKPNFTDSFSGTRSDYCGGGFPGCGAAPLDPAGLSTTMWTAMDLPNQLTRVGPISTLPLSENAMQLLDGQAGIEYVIWGTFDSANPETMTKMKNCTMQKFPIESRKLMEEGWQAWFPHDAVLSGSAPCSDVSGTCELWEWNHTFG